MTNARRVLSATIAVCSLLGGSSPALADVWPPTDTIYLMSAGPGRLYWSVDPADPELPESTVARECTSAGPTADEAACGTLAAGPGTSFDEYHWFDAASLLEAPPTWNSGTPLRFHVELEAPHPGVEMSLLLSKDGAISESAPAVEVTPGSYEGSLATGSPLTSTSMNAFGVRIRSDSAGARIRLKTRGASYLRLPHLVGARAVPGLVADDSYAPAPESFATGMRTFDFNDSDWSVVSFQGDLSANKRFDFALARGAAAALAWVETYPTPFTTDVAEGRPPDQRKLTDGATVRLLRGTQGVARAGGPYFGQGTGGLAAMGVTAGPLTLEVQVLRRSDQPMAYTAHVLFAHGERTIRTMRWRALAYEHWETPIAASCPDAQESVPVTAAVRSFRLDLDWETQALGDPGWTPMWYEPTTGAVYPCGNGAADWIRFTFPGARVWQVGAAPAPGKTFVSAFDTAYWYTVTYTYAP